MELQTNPLLSVQASVAEKKLKSLEDAGKFIDTLQPDIQQYIKDEYIKPQLIKELITSLYTVLESPECQRLQWQLLVEPLSKVMTSKDALPQLLKQDSLFKFIYEKYYHENSNNLAQFGSYINRLCVEWVMYKYH
jgi:hypothetical protein